MDMISNQLNHGDFLIVSSDIDNFDSVFSEKQSDTLMPVLV